MKKITLLLLLFCAGFSGIAQVLNQQANWPNANWNVTGSYFVSSGVFESNPIISSNFAYDDLAAGFGVNNSIAAESPVINLTNAHNAGEYWIKVNAPIVYNYNTNDYFGLQYWDTDNSVWVNWGLAFTTDTPNAPTNNYCNGTSVDFTSTILNIENFTPTNLAGFKYRFAFNDNGSWARGFCVSSPTIYSEGPPSCPAPSAVSISNVSGSSATINWTSGGSENSWEIVVQPSGTGIPTTSGTTINSLPYTVFNLTGLTNYEVYIRANCGGGDFSEWTGPNNFTTLEQTEYLVNCNVGPSIVNFCYGDNDTTLYHFTALDGVSPLQVTFNQGTVAPNDQLVIYDSDGTSVLYQGSGDTNGDLSYLSFQSFGTEMFVGVISDATTSCSSGTDITPWIFTVNCVTCTNQTVVFTPSVNCSNNEFSVKAVIQNMGEATSLNITDDQGSSAITATSTGSYTMGPYTLGSTVNLTVTNNNDPNCFVYSGPITETQCPPLQVSTNEYTIPELISDVLINSSCSDATNINWQSAAQFGGPESIGYFSGAYGFPVSEGIVMSTGDVLSVEGPNSSSSTSLSIPGWIGDDDISNITGEVFLNNASFIEFDFVPQIDHISFDYVFASEEYTPQYECNYSDVFAFILTDQDNNTTNLAVLPNSSTPVTVVTVHGGIGPCGPSNPEYFDMYNPIGTGSSEFNGQTVLLTAEADVIPGQTYHLKLGIADAGDFAYDSAVFLASESLNLGFCPPDNDNLCNALPINTIPESQSGLVATDAYLLVNSNSEPNEPSASCFTNTLDDTVWFSFTAPQTGEVEINTYLSDSTNNIELAVYDSTGVTCSDLTTLNTSIGCSTGTGTLLFDDTNPLTPGNTYYIQVNGLSNSPISFGLEVLYLGCMPASYSSTVVTQDCDNNQFFVDVTITGLGDNTPAISDGTNTWPITTTGLAHIGPFNTTQTVDLTLTHGEFSLCDVPLGSFTSSCIPNCVTNVSAVVNTSCGNQDTVILWDDSITADGYFISIGTTPGGTDIVDNIDLGTATSYTIAGEPATIYYYKISPYNSYGTNTTCSGFSYITHSTGCFCQAEPNNVDGDGITHIQLGNLDFDNPPVTYANYTTAPALIEQGTNTNLQLTYQTNDLAYHVKAWLDFNNDNVFDPTTEEVFSGITADLSPATLDASFTLPLNTTEGLHGLRVVSTRSGTPTPCYSANWGVVLDFNINVVVPGCYPATYDNVNLEADCDNSRFFVDLNITSIGNGNPTITDGTYTWPIVNTGVNQIGPFLSGLSPTLTLLHGNDSSCDEIIGTYTYQCPPPAPTGITCSTGIPTVVFEEEFDEIGGWTGDVANSGNGIWIVPGNSGTFGTGPSTAFSGANYMNFEASEASNTTASIISPAIDLSSALQQAELTFAMYAFGPNIGTLEVSIGTSATGPFTPVYAWTGSYQTSSIDNWTEIGIDLTSYIGQTIYLNFTETHNLGVQGDMTLDLVKVTACADCTSPVVLNTTIVPNCTNNEFYVDVNVSSFGDASTLDITDGTNIWNVLSTGTTQVGPFNTNIPVNLTLEHGDNNICDLDLGSFFYLCPPPTPSLTCTSSNSLVIFTEEFDTKGSWIGNINSGPVRWEVPDNSGTSNTGPDNAYSGDNFMNFEATGVTNYSASAISPAINLTGATAAELSFYMHAYGLDMGTLQVGISTSQAGPFTQIFQWEGQYQTSGSDPWVPVGIDISSYIGQTVYFEFKQIHQSGITGDMSIDLMEVTACSPCSPATVNSTNIVPDCDNFSYYVDVDVADLGSGGTLQITDGTNQWDVTSTGITQVGPFMSTFDTTLTAKVSENLLCAVDLGTFNYTCPTPPINGVSCSGSGSVYAFTEEFDAIGGWTGDVATSGSGVWEIPNNSETGNTGAILPQSGTHFMNFEADDVYDTTATIVSPAINLTSYNEAELSFYMYSYGVTMGDLTVKVGTSPTGPFTTVFGYSGEYQTNIFQSWLPIGIDISEFTGQTIYIAFEQYHYELSWGDMSIDLVQVEGCLSCQAPTLATTTAVGDCLNNQYYIDIDVSDAGTGTYLITDGTNNWPVTATGTMQIGPYTTATSTTLTLVNPTESNCNENLGDFTFNCPPPAPTGVNCSDSSTYIYTEEFDAIGGWTGNVATTGNGKWEIPNNSGSGGTGADNAYSGAHYMNFEASGVSNTTASAISPAIDLSSAMGEAELSFFMHAYGEATGTLSVGISTSQTGPFTNLFTWTGQLQTSGSDAWVPVGMDISSYIGQTVYVEFKQHHNNPSNTGDMSIDFMRIETCAQPCSPATYNTAVVNDDCDNSQFFVDVDITDLGNGTPAITDGTNSWNVTSAGVISVGPFADEASVDLTLTHGTDATCDVALGTFTYTCPFVCAPATYNTAVVNDDCDNSQFFVDIDIIDLGNGTPAITDGTNSWNVTSTGVISVGPFADEASVDLTLTHGTDATCDVALGTFTYTCPFVCAPATYNTAVVNDDCDNSQFFVDVDITDLGNGTPAITDGTNSWNVTSTGVISVGPFADEASVDLTLTHGTDATCDVALGTFTYTCPFVCAPATYNTAVVNDDCDNSQFFVDVDITDLGNGTPAITDGTNSWNVTSTGVISVGPFADEASVDLTLTHGTDTTCDVALGTFTYTCPFVCAPATYNTAVVNDDCGNSQFFVDIDITDLGNGTPAITDGTNSWNVTSTGVISVGPFVNAASVDLTLTHGTDATCDVALGTFTYTCSLVCTPATFASAAIQEDCTNSQFFVAIDVTGLGLGNSSVTDGVSTWNITALGVMNVGPFNSGSTTVLTILNDNGSACDVQVGTFTYTCPFVCAPATYNTAVVNDDCDNSQFFVDVDITDLGNGTPTITDGTNSWNVTSTGVISVGPFADEASVDLTLTHGTDATCDVALGTFTYTCPFVCAPATYNTAVVNDDCDNSQFFVDVDITDLGNGTPAITDGTNSWNVTSAGVISVGPFADEASVDLTLTHGTDATCDVALGTFTYSCSLVCTPATYNTAVVNDDCDNSQFFVAIDVTGLGSGNSSVTDGTSTWNITALGVMNVGPFSSGSTTTLTILNGSDSLCDTLVGTFAFTCPPSNDNICNATPLTVYNVSTMGNTPGDAYTNEGATTQTNEPNPDCFDDTLDGSVWFSFIAPIGGNVTITTDILGGTLTDTEIAVYDGSSGVNCTDLSVLPTPNACAQNNGVNISTAATLVFDGTVYPELTAGTLYYIQVAAGALSNFGTFGIEVVNMDTSATDHIANELQLEYYPNPVTRNTLNLIANKPMQSVEVFNMLGQKVMHTLPETDSYSLDLSAIASGNYILKIWIDNTLKTIKITKE